MGLCSGYNSGAVCGVAFVTTAQLHSTNPELRFSAGSNPALAVSEIRKDKDLSQLITVGNKDKRFCRSPIQQKQFIISTSCFFKINKGSYEKNKSVKNNIVPSNKTKKKERLVYNKLIVFFSRNIFFFLGLVFQFLLLCMVCELSIHYLFPGGTQFCCF